ncbi:transporter substrate-binding domain-containing protein [Pseudemcibacter aquimaris]|uniref:transporter substrate-binding domain-containing protein n=1 Tax=Pseudemcibacter aquimaris TaxID=2857064 RepID=UPI002012266E|nr:transporter substrate-binding domain-containing protein [Pseudemcibacter aquimaris]MCC3860317.1 transporter substrate-binding domain-containing protein [Pseudemcibacter aquimaris]WDU57643.1 transporter substrate-binding domain-containing protein [Pseudemcibacter aquimaris]
MGSRRFLYAFASLAKLIIAMLGAICISNNAAFSQTTIEFTDEERQWIENNPVLTVTNGMDLKPFDFVENGEPKGFAIDYMELIAKKTGLTFEYVSGYPWHQLLSKVRNGEIDIAQSLVQTEERLEYLLFTPSYIDEPIVNFGRIDSDRINSVDDLKDKKIGAVTGWAIHEIYRRLYPEFELIEYDTLEEVLRALSVGDIDVFTSSQYTVEFYISQNFIPNIEMIGHDVLFEDDTDSVVSHRIATQIDKPILLSILNKGIAAISFQEYDDISRKWRTGYNYDNSINLTTEELQWLSENPVINVAVDANLAPLEYIDENGDIQGIAGEYLSILSDKLNVEFIWSGSQDFSQALEHIRDSKAHIITAMGPTPEREREFFISDNYMSARHMIFAREGAPIYGTLDALNGKTLVQIKDHTINRRLRREYPGINLITAENIDEAFKMISLGQADAHVASLLTSSYYIMKGGYLNIAVVGETDINANTAMAINKEYPLLASAINKAMRSVTDLEKTMITNKWFSIRVENQVDRTIIWQIVAVSAFGFLIILLWNNSLRREVKRRKKTEAELIEARVVADTANKAKSTFLANMSHEIRTPLNAIIGFSEAMIMGVGGKLSTSTHKEYLTDIKNSGEHLAIVIRDILDLSKIEAGKWKLSEEDVRLDNLIEDSVKMLKQNADRKNVKLSVTGKMDIKLFIDAHAIRRALINLLSNAIKFVAEGGSVTVNTDYDDKHIVIEIIDNGIGIPADRLSQVLSPFEQYGGDHLINEEGTGLGLPIVKKLVDLHGGDFILESEVDIGTKARILLPISRMR